MKGYRERERERERERRKRRSRRNLFFETVFIHRLGRFLAGMLGSSPARNRRDLCRPELRTGRIRSLPKLWAMNAITITIVIRVKISRPDPPISFCPAITEHQSNWFQFCIHDRILSMPRFKSYRLNFYIFHIIFYWFDFFSLRKSVPRGSTQWPITNQVLTSDDQIIAIVSRLYDSRSVNWNTGRHSQIESWSDNWSYVSCHDSISFIDSLAGTDSIKELLSLIRLFIACSRVWFQLQHKLGRNMINFRWTSIF